ncbi:PAS domain-containing protein, partial [Clostridium butyricum]|uniref:PAS domain-containing protein n=1 Tax=Clostridium butyricum TaxID=1492 RepID=UPI002102B37D
MILFVQTDGWIIDANEAAINRYGYTREELTSMYIQDIRLNADRDKLIEQLRLAQTGIQFECMHHCKDGSIFPVDVSS